MCIEKRYVGTVVSEEVIATAGTEEANIRKIKSRAELAKQFDSGAGPGDGL